MSELLHSICIALAMGLCGLGAVMTLYVLLRTWGSLFDLLDDEENE